MKALFLLLCLLNLSVLLWEWRSGALDTPRIQARQLPELLLASEHITARRGAKITELLDQQIRGWQQADNEWILAKLRDDPAARSAWLKPQPGSVQVVVNKPDDEPRPVCFEVGPFNDETGLRQWLSGHGIVKSETVHREREVPLGFQVYYPAAKNPEQSRINKMMLNAKGINDFWTIPSGDLKGALSLGVFSDMRRAEIFKQQLAQQGIQADIKPRLKTQAQLFARLLLDHADKLKVADQTLSVSSCSRN